jgi:pimeloyl-ACP methyl ester carboxylesterase
MKLFFRKYGNGPPLIILHGLYGSSDNWVTIARHLEKDFTVYLPDLRNHGQSPHSDIHDYNSMSNDILELTQDLRINKFFLAGHSMGGKVAVNFAMKWPEKINSLIIIDISPFRPQESEIRFYNEHRNILDTLLSADLSRINTRAGADSYFAGKLLSEKTRGFILKNLNRTGENAFSWKLNVKSLSDNLEKIVDGLPRPPAYLDPVTGFPVTFIKGADSEYLPDYEIITIKKLFPAADIITVQNAGHWVHADRPDAIIAILLKQLQA